MSSYSFSMCLTTVYATWLQGELVGKLVKTFGLCMSKYFLYIYGRHNILMLKFFDFSQFSSVQSLSRVQLFATPWTVAHQASLSITNSWSLPKQMSLSRWCHSTISSSVIPFSSHFQSLPASGSFPMSQHFALGGQSIGVSASTSVI